MALTFNAILGCYGIGPGQTRLLRHQTGAARGRTLYTLWRDDHDAFLAYQSIRRSRTVHVWHRHIGRASS